MNAITELMSTVSGPTVANWVGLTGFLPRPEAAASSNACLRRRIGNVSALESVENSWMRQS
jgi:hypothetical protein